MILIVDSTAEQVSELSMSIQFDLHHSAFSPLILQVQPAAVSDRLPQPRPLLSSSGEMLNTTKGFSTVTVQGPSGSYCTQCSLSLSLSQSTIVARLCFVCEDFGMHVP